MVSGDDATTMAGVGEYDDDDDGAMVRMAASRRTDKRHGTARHAVVVCGVVVAVAMAANGADGDDDMRGDTVYGTVTMTVRR